MSVPQDIAHNKVSSDQATDVSVKLPARTIEDAAMVAMICTHAARRLGSCKTTLVRDVHSRQYMNVAVHTWAPNHVPGDERLDDICHFFVHLLALLAGRLILAIERHE